MDMDDPSLTKWLAAVRAIHFASCVLIGAVWVFDRFIATGNIPAWRRCAMRLLLLATPLALVSGIAWFVLVAASMSGSSVATTIHSTEVMRLVWSQTRFGKVWQLHAAFWFLGIVVALVWGRNRRGNWAGLIFAAGLVGSLAGAGHGTTGPAPAWHLATDVLHLLAATVWPAGLVPFGLLLLKMPRSSEMGRCDDVVALTRRFSAASLMAVGLLTCTGLFASYCLLGSFHALITTQYGRVLLIKLFLFAGMVSLGAINLLVHKPRLSTSETSLRRMRINVVFEIAFGTGVIVAVGLLGLLEPARQ